MSFSSIPARIGAGAATLATLAGLLFLFDPSLQPHFEQCGETGAGDLSQIRVEEGTFGEYLALSDQPPGVLVEHDAIVNGKKVKKWRWQRYPTSALEVRGNILLYKATIQGYRNEQIVLRYSLLRARDDSLLGPPTIAYEFKSPRCSSDQFGLPVWIDATPSTAGRPLYAELLLYSPKHLLIESGRSSRFRGATGS